MEIGKEREIVRKLPRPLPVEVPAKPKEEPGIPVELPKRKEPVPVSPNEPKKEGRND